MENDGVLRWYDELTYGKGGEVFRGDIISKTFADYLADVRVRPRPEELSPRG